MRDLERARADLEVEKNERSRLDGHLSKLKRRVRLSGGLLALLFLGYTIFSFLYAGKLDTTAGLASNELRKQRGTIEALEGSLGVRGISIPEYAQSIEVRFERGPSGDYVVPISTGYLDSTLAVWERAKREPNKRPVAFIVSFASHDAARPYWS